ATLDDPVAVGVDEAEARRRAPVPEQAGLDVLGAQRLAQERVGLQIDLADGQVVRGAPVRVDRRELVVVERRGRHVVLIVRRNAWPIVNPIFSSSPPWSEAVAPISLGPDSTFVWRR